MVLGRWAHLAKMNKAGKMTRLMALISLLVATVMGCALIEGDVSWSDGWRHGIVVAFEDGPSTPAKWVTNCDRGTVDADRQNHLKIEFRRAARRTILDAPLRAGEDWRVGDLVYVNVLDCEPRLKRR